MLADSDAMATIAVKDLETAKKFYGEKIGLQRHEQGDHRDWGAWLKDPDGNILHIPSM